MKLELLATLNEMEGRLDVNAVEATAQSLNAFLGRNAEYIEDEDYATLMQALNVLFGYINNQ